MKARQCFVPFAAVALVAAGIGTIASDAQAFRMIQNTTTGRVTGGALVPCNSPGGFAHWTNDSTINWFHNTAGQGSGKAAALQAAINSWTAVPNANHTPTYAGTMTSGWATDGVNTILWAVGNGCIGNCLALTALVLQSGQVVVESDITFNANVTWTTNGSNFDTRTVAAHELGHSLGIHHTEVTSTPLPTMTASYFGSDGRSLEADDRAALQCSQGRYPLQPPGGGGVPGAPTQLRRVDRLCNGGYRVAWNASTGVVNTYELYESSSSSFPFQTLISTGLTRERTVSAGFHGTSYFRVRACNTEGCGGYSNTLSLAGFQGCN